MGSVLLFLCIRKWRHVDNVNEFSPRNNISKMDDIFIWKIT